VNKGPSEIEDKIKKITSNIVSVSNAIRFVLIVDDKGNPIDSKVVTKSFLIKGSHAMPLQQTYLFLKDYLHYMMK